MAELDTETKDLVDNFTDLVMAAVADRSLILWEGCEVFSAPTGPPEEYLDVMVDGVRDQNVLWRGVPPTLAVTDLVMVIENPVTHRREIWGASGTGGASGGPHALLSAIHSDTTPVTPPTRASIITAQGVAPLWTELLRDTQGFFLKDDGTDVDWYRISAQTVTVGPGTTCEAATLGAAVAIVNAAGPATAANPWTILVFGIVTAEVGNVTIPAYCHVVGMGEGATIGMGANTLLTSDDSSMLNIKVTSSSGRAIDINNADCILRSVRVVAAGVYGIYIRGDSNCQLHSVIVEASAACTFGIAVDGTAVVLLDHCIVDDGTNFTDALSLFLLSTCEVTTRYCKFAGSSDDVEVASGTTWRHMCCQLDVTNITINGTEVFLDHVEESHGVAVYNSAALPLNNATWTSLTFNSEYATWGDIYGYHSTVANTNRLTVPVGLQGWYTITGHVAFATDGAGARQVGIRLNGTTWIALQVYRPSAIVNTYFSIPADWYLNVGDWVELRAYQSSGGVLNVNSVRSYSPEFRMIRI